MPACTASLQPTISRPATFWRRCSGGPRLVLLAALLIGMAEPGRACAADRPLDAIDLVGADVALCIELKNLRDELPRLKDSRLFRRLQSLAVYRRWQEGSHYQQLVKDKGELEQAFGQPAEVFIRELMGRQAVFALYLPPAGRPVGVLITRAASAAAVETAVAAWNQAGKHETRERLHRGQVYFSRSAMSSAGQVADTTYYVTLGKLFAVSDRETAIQAVIERHRTRQATTGKPDTPPAASSETPALSRHTDYCALEEALTGDPITKIYIAPRAWDATFQIESALSGTNPVSRTLARGWQSCHAIMVGGFIRDGVVFETIIKCPGSTPAVANFLHRTKGPPAELLGKIPETIVVAFIGRFDWGILGRWVEAEFGADHEQFVRFRQMARGLCLGYDLFSDILPELGQNWGFYIIPALDSRRKGWPIDGIAVWELPAPAKDSSSGNPDERPTLQVALDNALNTGLNLWAAFYNSRQPSTTAVVRTRKQGADSIRWVQGLAAYQPAYAITGQYCIFGSSPAAVEGFLQGAKRPLTRNAEYLRWSKLFFRDENQQCFFNITRWREVLVDRQPQLVKYLSETQKTPAAAVEQKLASLLDLLQLFDGAFVVAGAHQERVRLVIGGVLFEDSK